MHKQDPVSSRLFQRLSSLYQTIADKVTDMGLGVPLQDTTETHPLLKLETHLETLVMHFISKTEEIFEEHVTLGGVIRQNEQFMSNYYQSMLGLTESFTKFSRQLYSQSQNVDSLRSFRILYEAFSGCSTLLNGYTALTEEFTQAQQNYVQKQMQLFGKIAFKEQRVNGELKMDDKKESARSSSSEELEQLKEQNAELKEVLRRYEEEMSKYNPQDREPSNINSEYSQNTGERTQMLRKIAGLEAVVMENNDEFAVEIQKYNKLLYEEREGFHRLQLEADEEMRRLAFALRQLEKQMQHSKEEKFKDQLMIQNMARKLRGYERERRGMGSPPRGTGSPSPRLHNASSAVNIGVPRREYRRDLDI